MPRAADTPPASSAARTAASSPPGTRRSRPIDGRGEAGRGERGEGLVPALRPDGHGGAVADDRGEGALGDDAPGRHEDQAVALAGLVEVVCRDEDAGPAGRGAVDGVPERRAGAESDAGRGLVEDEQVRLVGEGGGEREAPPQPERQVADERAGGRREVGLQVGRSRAERLRRERQVLGDGEVLPEAEPLRHVAEPPAGRAGGRAAEQQDPPGRRPQQAEEQPDEGGLAGAVGAEEADHLAGSHLEVHAGDGGEGAEAAHGALGDGEPRASAPAPSRVLAGRSAPVACPACRTVAASRMRPSSSSTTVAARLASSRYVVETTTAAPPAAAAAMSRHSSARLTGSTPVVGSSSTSSSGSCSIASANASFCRMPPESRPASRPPVPVRPVCSSRRSIRASRSRPVRP